MLALRHQRQRANCDGGVLSPMNTLDGQLVLALPAALATGMSTGVGAAFTRVATRGGMLAWARAHLMVHRDPSTRWSTTSETTTSVCACAATPARRGAGLFGLRVGSGELLYMRDERAARAPGPDSRAVRWKHHLGDVACG